MNSALFIVKQSFDKGVGIKSYFKYRAFNGVFLMRKNHIRTSLNTADAENFYNIF